MTATKTNAAEATAKRGFGALPCPKCGADATVAIDLDNLSGPDACRCCECDDTFSVAAVRQWMAKWQRVLAWIEQAPALED